MVTDNIRIWLRLEGLSVAALAVILFDRSGQSWWLFAILFLAPDISLLGYLAGPRVGASLYNIFHSYVIPLLLAIVFLLSGISVAIPLIWCAHIGFDRLLGFGLKYPTAFSNTHLGTVGKRR